MSNNGLPEEFFNPVVKNTTMLFEFSVWVVVIVVWNIRVTVTVENIEKLIIYFVIA